MPDSISLASSAALESLQTPPTPEPSAPAPQEPTPTPTAPIDTPAAPASPSPLYKVKDNGEEVEVTLEELQAGHLRHRDYTRKTMSLAEEKKHFEGTIRQAQEREAAINQFLSSPEQVQRYLAYMTGGQQPAPPQPQEPAQPLQTYDDVVAHLAKQQKQMTSQYEQKLKEIESSATAQIESVRGAVLAEQAHKIQTAIDTTVKGVLDDPQYAVLQGLGPDVQQIIEADAQRILEATVPQGRGATMDEMRGALVSAAKMRAEGLDSKFKELLKQSAIKQTKLQTQGIEPPGGTVPVAPKPTNFKLGDKGLTEAAIEHLRAISKK